MILTASAAACVVVVVDVGADLPIFLLDSNPRFGAISSCDCTIVNIQKPTRTVMKMFLKKKIKSLD